jgi:acyl-CoA synthetase (AMP-forming)/AMP-acid ligase II
VYTGGENIYPLEIEERLAAHPSISRAVVVGLKNKHYGEVVGAFLEQMGGGRPKPSDQELRDWVRSRLGNHKAPSHIFWLGEEGVPETVPLTGSGKVRKFEMAELGNKILQKTAKL